MPTKKKKTTFNRKPQPFFRSFYQTWYLQLSKDKDAAWQRYHELMTGRRDVEATANTTVCAVLDVFLAWVKDWREVGTYRWFADHLSSFARRAGEQLKLLDLQPKHVAKWIDESHKNFAPDTVYGAIRSAQRAINWA